MSTTTLDIIQAQYPNRIVLSVEELGSLIHMTSPYIRKEVRAGRFFIPWRRIGSRIMFPVSAVVSTLEGGAPPTPHRRGRPTKAESIAREHQASRQER